MRDSLPKNGRRPRLRLPRLTLALRLTATFAAMALLSTGLAVLVQERTLSRDLRTAAEARLARAGRAAELLAAGHLRALEERYRAISGTPQLRATLELADRPTLDFFAGQLREQQGAAAILFRDALGRPTALSAAAALVAPSHWQGAHGLLSNADELWAVVHVPLETGGKRVGELVALERVAPTLLARWSELCGAQLVLGPRAASNDRVVMPVPGVEAAQLSVVADLDAEREALSAARRKLALAGVAALAAALVVCALLVRSLVRPIREIQAGVDRVREGDLATRLHSQRGDEIGDVARGIDLMAETLRASHEELGARVAELRRNQEHLATAQQLARVGSFDLDIATGRVDGTAEFWSVFGFADVRKGGTLDELVARLHPADRASVEEAAHACIEHGMGAHLDHRLVLPDGSERFCHTQFQRAFRGEDRRIEGTVQDITDRRRVDEQIRYLAYHDGLTGLGNRRLFTERLELAIAQARRVGTRLGVLFLDLDQF